MSMQQTKHILRWYSMTFNKDIIGERIKQCRRKKGLTQADVAEKLHVKRQIIGYYEKSQRTPNAEDLAFLAQEFDTTVDYLLGLTNYEKDPSPEAITMHKYTGIDENIIEYYHDRKRDLDDNPENDPVYMLESPIRLVNSLLSVDEFYDVEEVFLQYTERKNDLKKAIEEFKGSPNVDTDPFVESFSKVRQCLELFQLSHYQLMKTIERAFLAFDEYESMIDLVGTYFPYLLTETSRSYALQALRARRLNREKHETRKEV